MIYEAGCAVSHGEKDSEVTLYEDFFCTEKEIYSFLKAKRKEDPLYLFAFKTIGKIIMMTTYYKITNVKISFINF